MLVKRVDNRLSFEGHYNYKKPQNLSITNQVIRKINNSKNNFLMCDLYRKRLLANKNKKILDEKAFEENLLLEQLEENKKLSENTNLRVNILDLFLPMKRDSGIITLDDLNKDELLLQLEMIRNKFQEVKMIILVNKKSEEL